MAQNTTIDGIYYIDSFGCMIQQQTLCQFLGIDGQYYYNFLKTHIADKTYIGTTIQMMATRMAQMDLAVVLILLVLE